MGSLEQDMILIEQILKYKQQKLAEDMYSRSGVSSRVQDREIVPFLEAVIDSIKITNSRLTAIERRLEKSNIP